MFDIHHHHHHTATVNNHCDPGLKEELAKILLTHFRLLKGLIMVKAADIKAAQEENKVAQAAQATALAGLGTLIQGVLQALIDLRNAGGASQAELQELLDNTVNEKAAILANTALVQGDEDALTGGLTPPAPSPAPAPPVDDAFVPVGGARVSDGAVQTAESLAAAILVWNAANPDNQIPVA